ncbi:MAG: Gfo/Idh/MocA family oxidoreductase [Gemmatimonadales bacterium]|nr:Gfo/Idh/MocA family oxidoreductase [Gemmatimonadales bacterium]MDZ4388218.1 Gfo/Idh/MocA family oxidoreductase [Gemmatimonadales bacterium]
MSDALAVGVIGVGALGWHHARHLAAMPGAQLEGVYDIIPERCRAVAELLGVRAFESLPSLLDSCQAVSIAVPTPQHCAVGLEALGRGVAVLMEKPLATSLHEADELLAEAERQDVHFAVGHVERFNRAVRAARPCLDGPLFLEGVRLAPFQVRGTDVAVVLDLMIHDLDLASHLMGGAAAVEVRASGVSVLSPHLDMVHARVEFAGGAVASMTASRVARQRVRQLRLFQPSGYLLLDLANGTGSFMRLREGWQADVGESLEEIVETIPLEAPVADALSLELTAFVDAVRGEPASQEVAREGRTALELALWVAEAVESTPAPVLRR